MTLAKALGEGSTFTGYVCACGIEHKFPGYVYAQTAQGNVTHTCNCGRKNVVYRGSLRVELGKLPKKGKSDDQRRPTVRSRREPRP